MAEVLDPPMPWLSDEEINELCKPLTQPAAQVRYLRQVLKLTVTTKPNGRPVVIRSHAERVLSGMSASGASDEGGKPEVAPAGQPNRQALILRFKGAREHGAAKKKQPA